MRPRISGPSVAGSSPRMRSSPEVTGETAAIIRIVLDLPAPLGPRKPNDSPRRTSTSMPLTASTTSPDLLVNDLRRPTARIIESSTPVVTRQDPSPRVRQVSNDYLSGERRLFEVADIGVHSAQLHINGGGSPMGDMLTGPVGARARLRALLAEPTPLIAPGAYDALSARLVEQAGFGAGH